MLIEQFVGALATPFVHRALGFGPAKTHAICFSLFLGELPFGTLPELLQIDQVTHACLRHLNANAVRSCRHEMSGHGALADSVVM
jgi:hypothetical protein